MLGWQMSEAGDDKRGAAEYLKITTRAPVLIRPIGHRAGGVFVGDLLQRKGATDRVCGEPSASGGICRSERGLPGIQREPAVTPREEFGHQIRGRWPRL